MTRAQQTISLALLLSSVRYPEPLGNHCASIEPRLTKRLYPQLYLSLYLELIPLPAAIQQDIVPVVRSAPPLPALLSTR
jgi:hypothetical protein